jgi:2-aminobenzoate-CoA ligase
LTRRLPPTGATAHVDTFVREHLPSPDTWPALLYDLPELHYPARTNVAAELVDAHVAAGEGDRPALLTGDGVWSYRDLMLRANRLARVLVDDLGIVPGNRVLLRSPNSPALVAAWMAAAKAGAVIVATMPLLRSKELAVICDRARVGLALTDERLLDEIDKARGESEALRRIVTFTEMEERAAKKSPELANVDTAIDDPLLIAFTSGTTGKPKGCVHFHRDLLASADTYFKATVPWSKDDVFTGSPPLAFTFGLGMQLVFPFRVGARVALVEKPSPEALLECCERHRVSVLSTAPTAYRAMLPLLSRFDVSSLRVAVSAGETLPLPTWEAWKQATGVPIADGIGATEMFHIFISAGGDDIRPGATGKAVRGYEAKVFDDDGHELPRGEVGRLGVRGPTGCRYLDDPLRQAEYVKQGWNYTGDAYVLDEENYFIFQARTDDMIISAGYNISGPEVEEALLAHEAVADCACVASPDAERGNVVKAFVVLKPGAEAYESLARTLQDFVKARIAPYKYPREVELVESLPRTETGKVQRFKLRRLEIDRKASP